MTPGTEMRADVCWFDMDHTLINLDCDVSWKYFAVEHGLAPADAVSEADRYFEDYLAGRLDIAEFLRFQFREFIGRSAPEIDALAEAHFEERVRPRIYPAARDLIASLRHRNVPMAILTSTNTAVARPLARELGIDEVYGCVLDMAGGRCTGRIVGTYGVGPGKPQIARRVLGARGVTLDRVAYYGDSINDLPMLEAVGFPHTVNPSEELRTAALRRNWPVLHWVL